MAPGAAGSNPVIRPKFCNFPLPDVKLKSVFKKILIEINHALTSEAVSHYALKFAKLNDSSVFLVCQKGVDFEKAESVLKKVFLSAEKHNLQAQCFTKEGGRIEVLKEIIKKEKIDIAFLSANDFKTLLKLPCRVVIIKIINMGKISPKRILFILRGKVEPLKEKTFFIETLAKIFHAKIYINYFGKDKNIEKLFSILKQHEVKFESKTFPKFSYKTLIFQALSKRIELILIEPEKRRFLKIFKSAIEELFENPPCNLIIFKL